MHRLSGTFILLLTSLAIIASSLLLALAPPKADYWIWFFPAMICATLAIDLVFTVANVFFSSAFPADQQGLAGSLASVLVQLSIALLLGVADIVATISKKGQAQRYKNVFWFECTCGVSALLVFAFFVRIGSAKAATVNLCKDHRLSISTRTSSRNVEP